MGALVRRYDDPVEVRWDDLEGARESETAGPPEFFVWRGRVHRVREVLDHWRARTPWWRELLEGEGAPALEHEVWRVEASAGRLLECGVYDLARVIGAGGAEADWRLIRMGD